MYVTNATRYHFDCVGKIYVLNYGSSRLQWEPSLIYSQVLYEGLTQKWVLVHSSQSDWIMRKYYMKACMISVTTILRDIVVIFSDRVPVW